MNDMSHAIGIYQTIRERIIALEADLDEATLADTLEGITDIHEVLAAVVRSALFDEALADGLKNHIHRLQAMIEVEITKVAAPDFTLSLRAGSPALVVVDEVEVPDDYWEVREPRLNRASALSDLKNGVAIPGLQLSNPEPVLSVRVR